MRTCGGASWSTTRRRCTGFDVPHHADPRSRRMTAPVRGGHAKADRFDRPVEEAPRTGSAAASRFASPSRRGRATDSGRHHIISTSSASPSRRAAANPARSNSEREQRYCDEHCRADPRQHHENGEQTVLHDTHPHPLASSTVYTRCESLHLLIRVVAWVIGGVIR